MPEDIRFGPDRDKERLFVRARGPVDRRTAPDLYAALQDAMAQDWPEVVLDLREVTGFDEDGVEMVTHAWGVAQERRIRFKLVEGPREAMALLRSAPVHRNVDLVNPQRDPYDGAS